MGDALLSVVRVPGFVVDTTLDKEEQIRVIIQRLRRVGTAHLFSKMVGTAQPTERSLEHPGRASRSIPGRSIPGQPPISTPVAGGESNRLLSRSSISNTRVK